MNFKYHTIPEGERAWSCCVCICICAPRNVAATCRLREPHPNLMFFFLNWKGCLWVLNSRGRLHCPLNCPLTFTPHPETLLVRRGTHCSLLTPGLAFLYLWCECESVTVVNVMPPPGQIYNNNNNTGRSLAPPASPLPSLLSVSLNHFYFSANF